MKKYYHVFQTYDIIRYPNDNLMLKTVVYNEDTVEIRNSVLDKSWHKPGETTVSLKSTGNDLQISSRGRKFSLDYSEACDLQLALQQFHISKGYALEIKKVKKVKKNKKGKVKEHKA